jgi:hypothetical protein
MNIFLYTGNLRLSRVLPQIYNANKAPVQAQMGNLLHLLNDCDLSERASILQLCSLVAQEEPKALEPFIPLLCPHLCSTATSGLVLSAFTSMASESAQAFVRHIPKLKVTVEQQPTTLEGVARIYGAVGCLDQVSA